MLIITTMRKKKRKKSITYAYVYIANRKRRTSRTYRSDVMNAPRTFAMIATGVMNIKQIMRYGFVIDVMDSIVDIVMRWISAMIVMKLFVHRVPLYYHVNSVAGGCVKIVPLRVDGTFSF